MYFAKKKALLDTKTFSINVEIRRGNRLRRYCQVISPPAAKGL
jgi:hypothetical protein